jgi:hypothetical protein
MTVFPVGFAAYRVAALSVRFFAIALNDRKRIDWGTRRLRLRFAQGDIETRHSEPLLSFRTNVRNPIGFALSFLVAAISGGPFDFAQGDNLRDVSTSLNMTGSPFGCAQGDNGVIPLNMTTQNLDNK